MPLTNVLRRRNALWALLRQRSPLEPEFESALSELSALTHWPRERILAGLGLSPEEEEFLPER